MGYKTVHCAVRQLGLYLYCVRVIHELQLADPVKQMRYCKWFLNFLKMCLTMTILNAVFFSDKAWFVLEAWYHIQYRLNIVLGMLTRTCDNKNGIMGRLMSIISIIVNWLV